MSKSTPLSSVQNVLDRILLKEQPNETQSFLPSSTWQGTRPGYYFGTGDQGTGYYLDRKNNETLNQKKRSVQINETKNETRVYTPTPNHRTSSLTLLEEAEKHASKSTVVELTPRGIQIAANTLEKLIQKNAMQRAEYAEDAQLYMESELALHDHLQALTAVAANVELYSYILEETTLLDSLTQLLGHDNDDIAALVVSLYWEWLDPTLLKGDPDLAPIFQSLASRVLKEAWETIVANFVRFQDDDDEGDQQQPVDEADQGGASTTGNDPTLNGIDNALALMENLLDLDLMIPEGISGSDLSAAAHMVQETKIVSWLLEQVDTQQHQPRQRQQPSIEFQARCMELVAFIAQREDVHTILKDWSKLSKFATASSSTRDLANNNVEPPQKKSKQQDADDKGTILDGIECMLQTIGKFRKIQPQDDNEIGLLENTCLALSSCTTFSTNNLIAFLQGQGVELVVRCLKERVHSGATSLKLLDFVVSPHATTPDDDSLKKNAQNDDCYAQQGCERIITAGGLRYLFPLFVQTRIPQPAPAYATTTKAKREWLSTIESQTIRIFYSLSRYLKEDSPDEAKARFLSKFVQDEMKCDRLVELLLYYDEKARRAEYNFYRSDVEDIVEDEETIQLAALDAKLKGGGDLFHRLGALAAFVSVHSKRCHERILSQLQLQQSGISLVTMALEEFIELLEVNSPQRVQLESYLTKL